MASFKDSRSRLLEFVSAEAISLFKVLLHRKRVSSLGEPKHTAHSRGPRRCPQRLSEGTKDLGEARPERSSTTEPCHCPPPPSQPQQCLCLLWKQRWCRGGHWPLQHLRGELQVTAQEEHRAPGLVQDQHPRAKQKPHTLGCLGPWNNCSIPPHSPFLSLLLLLQPLQSFVFSLA